MQALTHGKPLPGILAAAYTSSLDVTGIARADNGLTRDTSRTDRLLALSQIAERLRPSTLDARQGILQFGALVRPPYNKANAI